MKANLLLLDRANHLAIETPNAFAPVARPKNRDLGYYLDELAADTVLVRFHTVAREKAIARDQRTYARRLDALEGWQRDEWRNRVVNGHVLDTVFETTLRRA